MDLKECYDKGLIKNVNPDRRLMSELKNSAMRRYTASQRNVKDKETQFLLLYDALRMLIETVVLEQGYKVYNHVCFVALLEKIIGRPIIADYFDTMRKMRNGLNYYGKRCSDDEYNLLIDKAHECLIKLGL